MVFKYHIKICSQTDHKKKLSTLKFVNRNTSQKAQINQWNLCINVKWSSEHFYTWESADMHRMYALKYTYIYEITTYYSIVFWGNL